MDYKKSLSLCLFTFIICISLAGCETEVSSQPLKIIGTPGTTLYFDSEFLFELGASGGDGLYRYRYIANPENPDDRVDGFVFNPVQMTIENTNDRRHKPSFTLRALPKVPEGVNFESLTSQKYKYQIELTDGINVVVEEYEFTLQLNEIKIKSTTTRVTEGAALNGTFSTLLRGRKSQLQSSDLANTVCRTIDDRTFDKTEQNGKTIYPMTIRVDLLAPVTRHTEFRYRTESIYSESVSERNSSNVGFARPGVDYLDDINTVVFEPGEQQCLLHVDIIDDQIIEGEEALTVKIIERTSGFVKFAGSNLIIKLIDDEPAITYETHEITKNKNDIITVPINIGAGYEFPLSVHVSIDDDNTTASKNQYKLRPESGIVTIPAGELEASYSLTLLDSIGTNITNQDEVVSIITDIDSLITSTNSTGREIKPFKISINQWPLDGKIDNEIVATSANKEVVKGMAVDADGLINVLIEKNINGNVTTLIKSYNKEGTLFNFLDTGDAVLKQDNFDVIPISISSLSRKNTHTLAVVSKVNGLFPGASTSHFGGTDFIVAIYQRALGEHYQLNSIKQYGTEGDDEISGALIANKDLYVFGSTNGKEFDGQPSFEINQGGEDGFVYRLNLAENTKRWSRFIGSPDQDGVVSVDAGRSDVIVLASQTNTDQDAFIRKLSTTTGFDKVDQDDIKISTIKDDTPKSIIFDQNNSIFHALLNSDVNLPSGEINSSLSQDVYLLSFSADINNASSTPISTSKDDFATDVQLLTKDNQILVAGNTFGEFSTNEKKGTSGTDAFLTFLSTSTGAKPKIESTLQFGTPGDDNIIDIEEVNERKFLVLWSENYTSGNGDIRYRISAFSPEGEKLSPNPQ